MLSGRMELPEVQDEVAKSAISVHFLEDMDPECL